MVRPDVMAALLRPYLAPDDDMTPLYVAPANATTPPGVLVSPRHQSASISREPAPLRHIGYRLSAIGYTNSLGRQPILPRRLRRRAKHRPWVSMPVK